MARRRNTCGAARAGVSQSDAEANLLAVFDAVPTAQRACNDGKKPRHDSQLTRSANVTGLVMAMARRSRSRIAYEGTEEYLANATSLMPPPSARNPLPTDRVRASLAEIGVTNGAGRGVQPNAR